MSEQAVQNQTEQTEQNEAPELTPEEQRDQYELDMVKKAVETGTVTLPENFKTAEEWVKSFKETRKNLTMLQQQQSSSEPTTETNSTESKGSDSEASLESLAQSLETETQTEEQKSAVDWNVVQSEIVKNGKLSDETRKQLQSLNVPDTMIQAAIAGFQAKQREATQSAAAIVGGEENLKKVIAWANANLPEDQRKALASQIRQPGWEMTLQGLYLRYQQAGNVEAIHAGGGGPVQNVEPFKSQAEMIAAMRDPRYKQGGEYADMVAARVLATQRRN